MPLEGDVHVLADQLDGAVHQCAAIGFGGAGQKVDAKGAVPADGLLDRGAIAVLGQNSSPSRTSLGTIIFDVGYVCRLQTSKGRQKSRPDF